MLKQINKRKYDVNKIKYSKPVGINEKDYRIKIILQFIGENNRVLDVGCYDCSITERINRHDNDSFGII